MAVSEKGRIGSSQIRTTVYAKYPIVDDNGEREEVKHVREICPYM
jgi:hypothetical protein